MSILPLKTIAPDLGAIVLFCAKLSIFISQCNVFKTIVKWKSKKNIKVLWMITQIF